MPRASVKIDKDRDLVRVGAAVRARRKALELSQEELADNAGIDRSHMGKIERGERNVSLINIIRIANALGCSPSEILSDADL
jgi:transcriptional regulator with XRE-family HTH domain